MSALSPHEQILHTATRLFFTQGYAQTGINQLIDESGVAKRTFYHHFASKEALGVAYLDQAANNWLSSLEAAARGRRSAAGVVRALFDHVQAFAQETAYRGCGILNFASEFADAEHDVRTRVREHKQAQRALMRRLFEPFGLSASVCDQVLVLIDGAIAFAAAALELAPIRAAAEAAELVVRAHTEENRHD